ncbi:hypothetical protein [Bacillus sp. NPDC077027]|uniref:hypothetical protein n=1 Tax=Bacillus sp. NPDC077027 TaxID=3390548 RepID=UPI003D01F267
MKKELEKELFLIMTRHATLIMIMGAFTFIVQPSLYQEPILLPVIILLLFQNLQDMVFWFYKWVNIKKGRSADLSNRWHVPFHVTQRLQQGFMGLYGVFFVYEIASGHTSFWLACFSVFIFFVVFLEHIQFYYVQFFFRTTSGQFNIPFLRSPRPSYLARERKARQHAS